MTQYTWHTTFHAQATLKPAESELTKSVEITSKDLHPTDPSKKPMGWADIKLRKVYLKEWQDRKDGVDEDEIISRRFKRELEVHMLYYRYLLF